ncbi:hypothetical protein BHM03_00017017 [Ensete ventricosum]|uniref:FAD-dependent oxidoreductase 2 FAD-binding domain-containing protein n=1 Tax=Ensete ventricosum TaxID=4639 RepID=A0A426ZY96_ENSVE|nr:hypothetical protein B296_00016116 [Ensete ventricosum]RZR89316.1 hypothetical protein BHM03_00017017 [Ensete ventricosum]
MFLTGSRGVGKETVSPLAGKVFVIIGAGGAGKALAYGAKEKGAKVVIANRTYVNLQQALGSYSVVFDAVYTPKVTRLLREAEESGATVVSGLEMFIRQAMGQFELFTNLTGNFLNILTPVWQALYASRSVVIMWSSSCLISFAAPENLMRDTVMRYT